MNTLSSLLYWLYEKVARDGKIYLNTSAASGTVDGDLYAAIVALGWQSDVIE